MKKLRKLLIKQRLCFNIRYLCYTGDMGTYVFQRLTDMFEFFRTDREYKKRNGGKLAVNLSYWGEKLQATPSP